MIVKGEEGKITGHATTCKQQLAVAALCSEDVPDLIFYRTESLTGMSALQWKMISQKKAEGTAFGT